MYLKKAVTVLYILVFLLLILILAGYFFYFPKPTKHKGVQKRPTQLATVPLTQNPITQSPAPTKTPKPTWVTHTIKSPHFTEMTWFTIEAPSNWNLEVVSEWPEQDGAGNNTGYNCTGLVLKRNDGKAMLFITPVCGFAEELPDICPEHTKVIEDRDDQPIIRHYDSQKGMYVYQILNVMSLPDEDYSNKQKPGVSCIGGIPTNGDVSWVYYEARIFNDKSEKENILSIIDRVVISGRN